MKTIRIAIKKMYVDVKLPKIKTLGSVGYDLHAHCPNGIKINPGGSAMIPTGIAIAIPDGYDGEVRSRSGIATKNLMIIPNSPATIDSDYRGEIFVCFYNLGSVQFEVKHHDRIAQLLIRESVGIEWDELIELPETPRGSNGFGHTGIGE